MGGIGSVYVVSSVPTGQLIDTTIIYSFYMSAVLNTTYISASFISPPQHIIEQDNHTQTVW